MTPDNILISYGNRTFCIVRTYDIINSGYTATTLEFDISKNILELVFSYDTHMERYSIEGCNEYIKMFDFKFFGWIQNVTLNQFCKMFELNYDYVLEFVELIEVKKKEIKQ